MVIVRLGLLCLQSTSSLSFFLGRRLAVQSDTPEGRIGCLACDPEQVFARVLACWGCLDRHLWHVWIAGVDIAVVGMSCLFLLVLLASLEFPSATNAV